jgi:hypothetical protein
MEMAAGHHCGGIAASVMGMEQKEVIGPGTVIGIGPSCCGQLG